ncbi:helix-turn-helix domain-containing protein [Protaetiibacter larvae]|uniref:TetR/AcrR family transcriptional regulator n=1 Tax=Protaetiibacter larvae TaxID=2592654 RepID=A0A5C1YAZ9_9MICO|nr:TetR/AcrR family transcriptional regulator [Protaetiibacter larvae]QEO10730.1 TetR/AcrR family transcriptional regulator [Protaetiibacter larvae]
MDESVDTDAAILASAAALLRESTFEDITYADIAEHSGVSERTIYRYFPTRSHLLESLARWIERERLPESDFTTIPEFIATVHQRFRAFDAAPAFAFVLARAASVSPTLDNPSSPLADSIERMLRSVAPTLNARDLRRTTAALRYFGSAMFWARMRSGLDGSAAQTSEVFERTVRTLLTSLPSEAWAA